jgi:hypothetical protein
MKFDKEKNFHIEENEIIRAVSNAFSQMLKRDSVLFDIKPQERTFMHRFAFELHKEFLEAEDYEVAGKNILSLDVEYNRDGKRLKYEDPENPETHKWIAPDIILHERMSGGYEGAAKNRNNILALEMKRDGTSDGKDAERLKKFLKKRKYLYAIDFYKFAGNGDSEFDLYDQNLNHKNFRYNNNLNMFEEV